jgi:phenylpyruvate tautomerase PptA (4-oxalocrotonate tautomerase family)
MPYIKVSLAQKLTPEKQTELACALGEALEAIPGKSRNMLIADIEDGKNYLSAV